MTNTQCDSCGSEFNSEEEGVGGETPDGGWSHICGSCEEEVARMAAEVYGDDLNR